MAHSNATWIDDKGNLRRKVVLKSPFGKYLESLRKQRGMASGTLERKTGLTHGHVWTIESGRCHPSKNTVRLLSDALNVDFDDMWEANKESKQRWQDQKRLELTDEERQIMRSGRKTHHVTVYLTHDEYLYCNDMSVSRGMSISSVVGDMVKESINAKT